jgi:hypothetical protein
MALALSLPISSSAPCPAANGRRVPKFRIDGNAWLMTDDDGCVHLFPTRRRHVPAQRYPKKLELASSTTSEEESSRMQQAITNK